MRLIYDVVKNFGNRCARLNIQVSTYDELPALGAIFENFFIQAGSHAEITHTGEFATLDADGYWYVAGVAVAGSDAATEG